MKSFKTIYAIAIALYMGLNTSCTKVEQEQTTPQTLTNIAINFKLETEKRGSDPSSRSITNPGADTDEATSPGYTPLDVWVFQFGGTTDQSPLIGRPQYLELSGGTNKIQAAASTQVNTLIFVANTHNTNLEWGNINTLGQMKLTCKRIEAESDCHSRNLYPVDDLILSGMHRGVITSQPITTHLIRTITRLDLTLSNSEGSTMTLRSIQLCNVQQDLYYSSITIPGDAIFPALTNGFNYPAEEITGAVNPGSEQSFTFYLPPNQRGTTPASTNSKTKSTMAPGHATYFKITATDPQHQAYIYKIYPGSNTTNDYNLRPNHRYTLALTINAPGDPSNDGRVQYYGPQNFESSNSFILNGAPLGAAQRTYNVPIDKVNEFWSVHDNALTISQSDTWTAELIWQDSPTADLVRFLDPITGLYTATTFTGTGTERIALTAKSGAQGNALIGIKKTGQEHLGYLWSWHLWITDYNPQYTAPPTPDTYTYPVPGGQVDRYSGQAWKAPAGRYHNKYIMDRNLGARNSSYTSVGVLYYQFGRKDPMPGRGYGNALYDINGVPLPDSDPRNATIQNKNAGNGVTMATGVLNPTFFYIKSAVTGYGDWTSQGAPVGHMWNHPIKGGNHKSFYDPCPSGWKVITDDAIIDMEYFVNSPAASTVLHIQRDPRLAWNHQNTPGLRYWPANSQINGEIIYPGVGFRTLGGTMYDMGTGFVCWMAEPISNLSGHYLISRATVTDFAFGKGGDHKSYGFLVRCIQQ